MPGSTQESPLEFKAKDGAWYSGVASFVGAFLRVHFEGYSEDEDERWHFSRFKTLEEVRQSIRPSSQPMQDHQCKTIYKGMRLCVACRRRRSDCFEYYDATVTQISRLKHGVGSAREERCKCNFVVVWNAGPLQGKTSLVECGDICLLVPGDIEDDPAVRTFVDKVQASRQAGNVLKEFSNSGEMSSKPDDDERLDSFLRKEQARKKRRMAGVDPHNNLGDLDENGKAFRDREEQVGCLPPSSCITSHDRWGGFSRGKRKRTTKDPKAFQHTCQDTMIGTNDNVRSDAVDNGALVKEKDLRSAQNTIELLAPGALNDIDLLKETFIAEKRSHFQTSLEEAGEACEYNPDEGLDINKQTYFGGQDGLMESSQSSGQRRQMGAIETSSDVGKGTMLTGMENGNMKVMEDRGKMDKLQQGETTSQICSPLGQATADCQNRCTLQQRNMGYETVISLQAISSIKDPEVEVIDLEAQEDVKPLLAKMNGTEQVQKPMMKEGMWSGLYRAATSSFYTSSGHVNSDKEDSDTLLSSDMRIGGHGSKQDPTRTVLPSQSSAARHGITSATNAPTAIFVDANTGCNISMQGKSLPSGMSAHPPKKTAAAPSIDRLHSKLPIGIQPEADHLQNSVSGKDAPYAVNRPPQPPHVPFSDGVGNQDYITHDRSQSGLFKEHVFSQSCWNRSEHPVHAPSCSLSAFESSCKSSSCIECSNVILTRHNSMGFPMFGHVGTQTHVCGHASACPHEGQKHCHYDVHSCMRCSENSSRKAWCQHASTCYQGHGDNKSSCSHFGCESHAVQCQHFHDFDNCKGDLRTRGDGSSTNYERAEEEVEISTSSQLLLVENMEKDVTSSDALKVVSKVSHGAVSVYILPSLEYETTTRGYICYRDSKSADDAYSTLLGGKFFVVSTKGRPWVISRAKVDLTGCAVPTFKGERQDGVIEVDKYENEGLSIIYNDTGDYILAQAKRTLFLEQRKELRLSYLRFSKEEEDLERDPCS